MDLKLPMHCGDVNFDNPALLSDELRETSNTSGKWAKRRVDTIRNKRSFPEDKLHCCMQQCLVNTSRMVNKDRLPT